MVKATAELLYHAYKLDGLKERIFKGKCDYVSAFSDDSVDGFVLYYAFLHALKGSAFDVELETIDAIVGRYSTRNAERLKAMTSILQTDAFMVDMIAFNGLIEAINGLEITMDTVEPYSAEEIANTSAVIMAILGAENFPFDGDVLRYIKASFDWEGWMLPPLFLDIPRIRAMYGKDVLRAKSQIDAIAGGFSLVELAAFDNPFEYGDITKRFPWVGNYFMQNSAGAKFLLSMKRKRAQEIVSIFGVAIDAKDL